MKAYTFEVIIHQGRDHFWDTEPSDKEVTEMFIEAIEAMGTIEIKRNGGYEFANDEVRLVKMELLP